MADGSLKLSYAEYLKKGLYYGLRDSMSLLPLVEGLCIVRVNLSEEILSLRTENAAIFVSACRPMRRIIRVAFSAGGAMTAQHAHEMDNVDQSEEDGGLQGQREKQTHART